MVTAANANAFLACGDPVSKWNRSIRPTRVIKHALSSASL